MSPDEPEGQHRGAWHWTAWMQDIDFGFGCKHSCMRMLENAAVISDHEQKEPSRSTCYCFFSMRQPKWESLKQKTESKSIDSQISALDSRLFLPLWALYFVQSPSCQLGGSDRVWQTDTRMQLPFQVTDRLRPTASGQLRKQNLKHGGKRCLQLLRELNKLRYSISLLRALCLKYMWQVVSNNHLFFLKTLMNLGLYIYKGERSCLYMCTHLLGT